MNDHEFRLAIDKLTTLLNSQMQSRLGDRIETLMYLGSYAQGRISLDRPDINYVLIWKNRGTSDDYLTLGEILSEAISEFLDRFVVRPEFRPYKFSYPVARKERDVFVNISCFDMADKDRKFFLPEYVLDGFKHSRKMLYGTDVFADMEFEVTKQSILESAMRKLASHKIQLDRVPLTYDIERDFDLIFNESLDHGKNVAYFGVEVAMTDDQIRSKEYLEVIGDKRKLMQFYERHYSEDAGSALRTVLESRDHYKMWKNERQRAVDVYRAAFLLHNEVKSAVIKQLAG